MKERVHLFENYYYVEVTAQEVLDIYDRYSMEVYDNAPEIHVKLSAEENQKIQQLSKLIAERFALHIAIMRDEEIIGWHFGWQENEEKYFMCDTAILKAYQRKGIYSCFLSRLLIVLKEKGFQKIYSKHHASNNAVIIPKLKAGFFITGFEVDERFGLFVLLNYICNEKRMNAYKYRVGALRPDEQIKKYIGL